MKLILLFIFGLSSSFDYCKHDSGHLFCNMNCLRIPLCNESTSGSTSRAGTSGYDHSHHELRMNNSIVVRGLMNALNLQRTQLVLGKLGYQFLDFWDPPFKILHQGNRMNEMVNYLT